MRYLFSTGLFGAITTGVSLLRGTRESPVTWRAALAWISWAITFALAIGAVRDTRRFDRGLEVALDSPLAPAQAKRANRDEKQAQKAAAQKRTRRRSS
ncbi:hypothetical protein ACTJKK_02495 [Microbacterium sp. 22179]|jgi:hypothetical protein|uniref:hypothetical protein n=1 Tax=Microbacterium TaxID=33882 RepID=UPI001FFD3029|nr:hypothetical protein [Microbacterium galbinum]MBQ3358272.1 hypothetical protein [Microbacterium sp.]MCK2021971.1 hypothetical protein [Microbacterium galbinum]MCK2028764.1 hypothetical protein [Microbacterium galbinum]